MVYVVKRLALSVLAGLANGALVWTVSNALGTPHVWPGTIVAFASTAASTLLLLRGARKGGR